MMFSYLPRELESEILSRVSAISLTKLRTTCKRWYALFKDQSFINKNLRNAATTNVVLLQNDFRVHSVSIHLNLNDPSIELTGKLNILKDSETVDISEIFHCDGLLLCTTRDDRLVVWNPCTGQTRWIKPSNRKKENNRYVLGQYENNRHKILRYSYFYNEVSQLCNLEFEIYDFNTDSWRILDDFNQNWYIYNDPRGGDMCLRGNTYFVAGDNEEPLHIEFLLKFDFRTERFERLSLSFVHNHGCGIVRLLADRQEKLFVLLVRFVWDPVGLEYITTKIWVTDEAKDTKIQYLLVADLGKFAMPSMMHLSYFLVEKEMVVYFSMDTNQKEREKTIIYIVGNENNCIHVRKHVYEGKIAQGPNYWTHLVNYVPSLVRIQQPEAKEKGSQPI